MTVAVNLQKPHQRAMMKNWEAANVFASLEFVQTLWHEAECMHMYSTHVPTHSAQPGRWCRMNLNNTPWTIEQCNYRVSYYSQLSQTKLQWMNSQPIKTACTKGSFCTTEMRLPWHPQGWVDKSNVYSHLYWIEEPGMFFSQVSLIASRLSLLPALAWIKIKRRFGESLEMGRGSIMLQSSATQLSGRTHPMDVEREPVKNSSSLYTITAHQTFAQDWCNIHLRVWRPLIIAEST